jgi:hypothetical protein
MQVWPIEVEMKFLEPFGRELHSMKKVQTSARGFLLHLIMCFQLYQVSLTELQICAIAYVLLLTALQVCAIILIVCSELQSIFNKTPKCSVNVALFAK